MAVVIDGVEVTQEVGVGQAWTDVLADRVVGVIYTNTTNKPIMVAVVQIGSAYSGASLYIDDVRIGYSSSYGNETAMRGGTSGFVPVNGEYNTTVNCESWAELK